LKAGTGGASRRRPLLSILAVRPLAGHTAAKGRIKRRNFETKAK
jgi:hypothetical protein